MKVAFPTPAELATRKRVITRRTGTIVAFYTTNSFFEYEKERLLASARYLGLKIICIAVDDSGSWVRNAGKKSGVLLQQRKILRGPLLYVDVDTVLHRDPWSELLPIRNDISVYYEKSGIF